MGAVMGICGVHYGKPACRAPSRHRATRHRAMTAGSLARTRARERETRTRRDGTTAATAASADERARASVTRAMARAADNPHTITGLIVLAIALAVTANVISGDGMDETAASARAATRRGIVGGIWAYAAYGAMQGPDTHMTRPHASVWRVVHALFIVYLLALVFLLHQTPRGAQEALKFFWDDLGTPLESRSYGEDCRIYVPGHRSGAFGIVKETIFDEFTLAHFMGWMGKAIAIRDWGLVWAYSVAFELCELTFEHWQPNFNECWWDMWVWDVLVCNALGIALGMWTVRFLRGRMYDWSGKQSRKGSPAIEDDDEDDDARRSRRGDPPSSPLVGALKSVVAAITPDSVEKYTWRPTDSPARFLKSAFLVFCGLAFDLNLFFLKYVLQIPTTHSVSLFRLYIWFGMSNIAIREYYVFIEEPDASKAKLGPNAWLAMAVLVVEMLVIVKHGRGKFTNPWPRHILLAWFIAISSTTVYLIAWQRRINLAQARRGGSERAPAPAKKMSSRRGRKSA